MIRGKRSEKRFELLLLMLSLITVLSTLVLLVPFLPLVEGGVEVKPGSSQATPQQPQDPIIGILTQPNLHTDSWGASCPGYIQQTYVVWLQQAGIRAVPIHYDEEDFSKTEAMLGNLNGLLFTGGMQNTTVPSQFYTTAKRLTQYAMERNKAGDRFVLWGTCQGFQLISMAIEDDQSILECDYEGTMVQMMSLNMSEPAAKTSKLYGGEIFTNESSPLLYSDLTTKPTTANGHNCGIRPSVFSSSQGQLFKNFNVLSTNVDNRNKPFVSTFEHKSFEIYGLQWHPEGAEFWFDMGFNKNPSTIRVSQYMAAFIVSRLRMNNRSFSGGPEEAYQHLITKWPLKHIPASQYSGFYCPRQDNLEMVTQSLKAWQAVGITAILLLLGTWTYLFFVYNRRHAQKKRGGAGFEDVEVSSARRKALRSSPTGTADFQCVTASSKGATEASTSRTARDCSYETLQ